MQPPFYLPPRCGKRLVPQVIDERARTSPRMVFASYPRSLNLQDGFRDVNYLQLANAVNACAWWIEAQIGKGSTFETLAYIGPSDLRYAILTIAAIKTGYKAFFTSPRNSIEGHLSLLEVTQCQYFLVSKAGHPIVDEILSQRPMQKLVVPELEEWLNGPDVSLYSYTKTFSEARHEPFVALHTSGSTGVPKIVIQTHGTVAAVDAWHLIPSHGATPTIISSFRGIRKFMPFPAFHAAGLGFMLPLSVFCEMTTVLPPTVPLTAEIANMCHVYGNVQGTILPASVLTELVRVPEYLENLRALSFVAFGGAPLPKRIGDIVKTVSWPVNWLGATEMIFTPLEKMEAEDWEYMKFTPYMGAEFRHHSEDLYELVIVRHPQLDVYQGIFCTYPDLQEYSMKDLYSKHPSKPDLWRYCGRADDIIVFSNGEKMNPLAMEEHIGAHKNVKAALILGSGRFQSALLIEPAIPAITKDERQKLLEGIWKTVEDANRKCVAHGRVAKHLVMFTSPTKPFLRAGKGTVQRKLTLRAYQNEIDAHYSMVEKGPSCNEVRTANKSSCRHNDDNVSIDAYSISSVQSSLRDWFTNSAGIALREDDDFYQHGVDSLQTVNLVRHINITLGKPAVDSKMVYQNPTLRRLATAILSTAQSYGNGHTNGLSNAETRAHKLQKLVDSFASDLPISSRPSTSTSDELHVILTGSTGSLGSYLLRELLYNPRVARVYCLNRSADAAKKQERSFDEKWLSKAGLSTRAEFVRCDLSLPYLGLRPFVYQRLLDRVTHVLHNAWEVNFNLGLNSFTNTHIHGVRQLVDFSARSAKGAFIFFVSSIGTVAQWQEKDNGPVPEMIHRDWSIPQTMGYAEAKHVSEIILDEASRVAGIPTAVCRVGQIAGPTSPDGMWSKQEWLPTMIASSKYLQKIPSSLGFMDTVDWIPVDLLGQTIVELLTTLRPGQLETQWGCDHEYEAPNEATGWSKGIMGHTCKEPAGARVFHTVNPQNTTWPSLLPAIQQCIGSDVEVVPLSEWVDALKSDSATSEDLAVNPGLKLQDFFEELELGPGRPSLQTLKTSTHSETLANMPPVSGQWMRTWMKQWNF